MATITLVQLVAPAQLAGTDAAAVYTAPALTSAKIGRAADAMRKAAEVADGKACDECLDALLRELTPAPRNAYADVKPRLQIPK